MEVNTMAVDWSYFDRFDNIIDKYLPSMGQGETEASQVVAAVCKLIYKWYNDGDVFDNTYHLNGWANDLSSYANWLDQNTAMAGDILWKIASCWDDSDYEDLLMELADTLLNEEYLEKKNQMKKYRDIYCCYGRFKFEEYSEDDEW
jgi:hypothetical protein